MKFQTGDQVGTLLGIKSEDLYNNFMKPSIKIGTEFVTKRQNSNQCTYAVGAMAKTMFYRLFKFKSSQVKFN